MPTKQPRFEGQKLLARAVHNWPAKVLSVALAILISIFHRWSILEERFFSAPLGVELNAGLVPAHSYTRMIRVSLRGEANVINPIMEDDIEVYLDLSRYTEPGNYRAPVRVRRKGTALETGSLEINVDPAEVSLSLDQKVSKYLPLSARFEGYPETGYELVSYSLNPSQVSVEGPLSLMANLLELPTEAVDLSGRTGDFTATVAILNRDPLLLVRGAATVELQGSIRRLIMVRYLEGLPIEIRGLAGGLELDGNLLVNLSGSIRLEGDQELLEPWDPLGVSQGGRPLSVLYLDASRIREPGTYSLPVLANIPAGFTLIRSDPQNLTLTVRSPEAEIETGTVEEAEGP
ncbi:MAG: hypothetical protein LBT11_06345 [Treponema sp.]|jgi:hypothetical protein|nr:hypothetical protein [Treponema sp.]